MIICTKLKYIITFYFYLNNVPNVLLSNSWGFIVNTMKAIELDNRKCFSNSSNDLKKKKVLDGNRECY